MDPVAAQDLRPSQGETAADTLEQPADTVITASALTKRYGDFTAVDALDLSIRRGEIFGLLGPNGAGKTTTILMLLGLTEPTSGYVRVAGFDPVRDPLSVKSIVGYLPDNVGFYPNMTGRQNLRYTASLNQVPRKEAEERIDSLLQEVGLADAADKRAGKYSRGMRQRLAIADALVKRPSILILDEPTIGIDPEGVRDLLAMLSRLRDEGITILLSSHLLYQVQAVCNRVGIFVGGRMIAAGPVDELERQLAEDTSVETELGVAGADGGQPDAQAVERLVQAIEAHQKVLQVRREGSLLIISSESEVRPELLEIVAAQRLLPLHVRTRGLSLDNIYDRYFREEVSADVRA